MWCCLKHKNKSFHISSTLYNIVNNFEETTIDECIKMDKNNEKIYTELLSKAAKAEENVKNSSIYMTIEVPPPPRPSNRDRYTIWHKRMVTRPVIEQSEAVLFLSLKGLKYDVDYEAYQAIELAKEYRRKHNIKENNVDKSKLFDSVFTHSDTNLIRRKSLKSVNYVGKSNRYSDSDGCLDHDTPEYDFEEYENNVTETKNIININTVPSAPPLGVYPSLEMRND
jgi:hypothetical protein